MLPQASRLSRPPLKREVSGARSKFSFVVEKFPPKVSNLDFMCAVTMSISRPEWEMVI